MPRAVQCPHAPAAGIHLTSFYLGAVLGGVGGWLAERHTWHFAFAAVGLASIAYGMILMFLLPV